MKKSVSKIVDHIRNRPYMSGIDRNKSRVKFTSEIFTPTPLVQEILDNFDNSIFTDSTKRVIDPCCGDGQFLGEVLIRRIENGLDFESSLSTIYGVDLMQDNVDLCRTRLLSGFDNLFHIVKKNILCADFLKMKQFRFDGTDPYKSNQDLHNEKLFDFE